VPRSTVYPDRKIHSAAAWSKHAAEATTPGSRPAPRGGDSMTCCLISGVASTPRDVIRPCEATLAR